MHDIVFLFGLAPNGVYPATFVTKSAVSSYLAVSPLPLQGGLFSVALSTRYQVWTLSSILPYGARTFLRINGDHPPILLL
jgi:hypothetical protein